MLPDQNRAVFIRTGSVIPLWFFIWMDFFMFYPCGFYLGCGFSKVPADAFIRMVFHMLPLWFLGCDSTISYPCGFYSACVFSMVPGDVFLRVRFLELFAFIQPMFFRKFLVMFLFHQCAQSSSIEYCFAALLYKKEKLPYTLQSVANKEKKIHLILQMKLMFCYLYGLQRMPFYIKEGL